MISNITIPADVKKFNVSELYKLCGELRSKIIDTTLRNGGHLASNLGIIELTVALYYVFNAPQDKIIFDVGHQCYSHKILCERGKDFHTLRLQNGISGFPRRKESIYDHTNAGHSSTSISQGIGFLVANKLKGCNDRVIIVIGDGALTGGVAFEGLNFIGSTELPVIIILNDNGMSISESVGGLSCHINEVTNSHLYDNTKLFMEKQLDNGLFLKNNSSFYSKLNRRLKLFSQFKKSNKSSNLFTNLRIEYVGPIDGHNLDDLIRILKKVDESDLKQPILLHIKTIKGKGYENAEINPMDYHGVFSRSSNKDNETFTSVFSKKIVEMGERCNNIIAVTAAMETGTGLDYFKLKFPKRFFDVGIAEQHAVSFCSSLAYEGFKPICAVYSTFLMRALDQVCQDICIGNAPVIFAIDRAGIVGTDGETHQGQFDITYLRMLPNMVIMAPCDANELELMLEYGYKLNSPVAIRYPRDITKKDVINNKKYYNIQENPCIQLKKGRDLLIIVVGVFIEIANEAVKTLEQLNIDVGIMYLRILKPLPEQEILNSLKNYKATIVIEENVLAGSITESLSSLILRNNLLNKFDSINIPDRFIEHDTRKNILKKLGFTSANIVKLAMKLLT